MKIVLYVSALFSLISVSSASFAQSCLKCAGSRVNPYCQYADSGAGFKICRAYNVDGDFTPQEQHGGIWCVQSVPCLVGQVKKDSDPNTEVAQMCQVGQATGA